MGAYRSTPIKQKEQEEGGNDKLSYACTSMQGWRIHQEDAHNCLVDFGENSSFFAVYDGHGGSEVAIYISENFPDYLKKNDLLTNDDISLAFKNCFIDFDHSLCSEKVILAMNSIKEKSNPTKTITDEAEKREALLEEAVALSKEANVSLETIIKQYSEISRQLHDASYNEAKSEKRTLGEPSFCLVKRRKIHRENATVVEDEDPDIENASKKVSLTTCTENLSKVNGLPNKLEKEEEDDDESTKIVTFDGGDADTKKSNTDEGPTVTTDSAFTNVKKNGKKNFVASKSEQPHSTKSDFAEAETSTDEEEDDEDYEADEECEDDEQVVDEGAEDKEEDEEEEDFETEFNAGRNKPGFDSGATACVALLHKNRVIVANVGDSRAVLCRDGKAIDLSTDHKPEDTVERTRIEKAGGTVGEDGRVNGGLNLSRALGDHYYKQKTDISLDEQMITACPDVLINNLTEKDTLLVIACDGIWNSLTSQEVIDFVNDHIDTIPLKKIGSEICELCCAPDTSGDGTGCDNMTIIIVDLKNGASNKETKITNEANFVDS